jgi:O-acetyl-ADP-ribose deacetylase (regulator of RNase III)/transcriptional regulator with XRE-family HTH domain
MPFQIIRNDITKVKADAIVNTANPYVDVGSGVDAAIYDAAGREQLLAEREKIGELMPGEVGITPAFKLDAKYIIHSSGPIWHGGNEGEADLLRQCYDRSLSLAYDHGCESIAFPLMATGAYKFPKELAMQIAVDAFTAFLEDHEMEITLVVFGSDAVKISGELVDEVASFIDDRYEAEALEREHVLMAAPMAAMACFDAAPPVEDKPLEDVLKDIYTDSFEKHLQQLINKKGLKNSEIYSAANISKQYFSKLLKGQVKPSKEKTLALAVGLRLNLDETVDFLQMAGYALSPISQTDAVVRYFINKKEYNVIKINFVLFDFGLDPLT